MSRDLLADRGKGLDESFFAKHNEALRQRLRDREQVRKQKEALSAASGIADHVVLEELVALEFGSDTLPALSLVPLVAVAWADGRIDDKEHRALLSAAEEMGIAKQDPSWQLTERWLVRQPTPDLLLAWKYYVRARWITLSSEAQCAMRAKLLDRARAVAAATGGFLGIGQKVSASEEDVLEELERALPFP